jgi:hypothetical protein
MIYIATVHWQSDVWIRVQLAYLHRFVTQPFRTFACLEGVPSSNEDFFDVVVPATGRHAGKLNLLANAIALEANDQDRIYFLDGDAFPVGDLVSTVETMLGKVPLVAVRRDENGSDRQPHPCFCATTVGFWRQIGGDWSEGFAWQTDNGMCSDVGGNLLYLLETQRHEWLPLLRTNTRDLHPLFFGVYGDVIYHHGAGFRARSSRLDIPPFPQFLSRWNFMPRPVRRVAYLWYKKFRRKRNARLSAKVCRWIAQDADFFRRFVA